MPLSSDQPYSDNAALIADLRQLLDAWCDRRCLAELSTVLPGYFALNGMTDGWAELYAALRNARARFRDSLPQQELEVVNRLISATEKIVDR